MKTTPSITIGGKILIHLLVAAIALGVATTANAAYWDWKGKPSGTSYFDDTSCWLKSGSTAFKDSNHNISAVRGNINVDWDKIITFREITQLAGQIASEYADAPVVFEAEDDGYGVNSSGILNIYNGAEIQIQSGTYRFSYFQIGTGTTGGTLTLNGGTLKATGSSRRNTVFRSSCCRIRN